MLVNYREDLAKIIKKCLLISEMAALASIPHHDSERKTIVQRFDAFGKMYVNPLGGKAASGDESSCEEDAASMANEFVTIPSSGKSFNHRFSSLEECEIAEMLDEWEEPEFCHGNVHVSDGPFLDC
jgi:hypothetical protein